MKNIYKLTIEKKIKSKLYIYSRYTRTRVESYFRHFLNSYKKKIVPGAGFGKKIPGGAVATPKRGRLRNPAVGCWLKSVRAVGVRARG